MKLPAWLTVLGFAGLVPFAAGPLFEAMGYAWLWDFRIDALWRTYVQLVAAFLAGTFWGFALTAVEGPAGVVGVLIATAAMALIGAASLLSSTAWLVAFALIYILLLGADVWRERMLDTIPGYFRLRTILTLGALASLALRAI